MGAPFRFVALDATLSDLENKFYFRAMARNIPIPDIAKVISWSREGCVDLNSFFVVENTPPLRMSRFDHLKMAITQIRCACRIRFRVAWKP